MRLSMIPSARLFAAAIVLACLACALPSPARAATTEPASDPRDLMERASRIMDGQVRPRVFLLEFWGNDLPTQAALAPAAQQAIHLLQQTAEQAQKRMDAIAAILQSPDDPAVARWKEMDQLKRGAEYARHAARYALAMSMDGGDPQRKTLADSSIDYLRRYDDGDSGVQASVRLQLTRWMILLQQYKSAHRLAASVASSRPAPSNRQAVEAKNLESLAEFLSGDLKQASRIDDALAAGGTDHGGNSAAAILHCRILWALADLASDAARHRSLNQQADTALSELLKSQPELWPVARRRLISRAGVDPNFGGLDALTLRAFLQEADIQRQSASPDAAAMEHGLSAARQLLKLDAPDLQDQASILIPALLEKLGRESLAASAYMDYLDRPGGAFRDQAFDHARWLTEQLAHSRPKDAGIRSLYARFLKLATVTLHKHEFAFEYARLLESTGEYAQAAHFYDLVPTKDPRHDQAMAGATRCLMRDGRLNEAAEQLNELLRNNPTSAAAAYLRPLLDDLDARYADVLGRQDKAAMIAVAQARAGLSERLPQRADLPADRLYQADCRRVAVSLSPSSSERSKALESLLEEYRSLSKNRAIRARAQLGEALIDFSLGRWRACADLLRPLLESGDLGGGTRVEQSTTGPSRVADNPIYWEARYTLLEARRNLGDATVARDLELLYAKWGENLGGRSYHGQFQSLRKLLAPDAAP